MQTGGPKAQRFHIPALYQIAFLNWALTFPCTNIPPFGKPQLPGLLALGLIIVTAVQGNEGETVEGKEEGENRMVRGILPGWPTLPDTFQHYPGLLEEGVRGHLYDQRAAGKKMVG